MKKALAFATIALFLGSAPVLAEDTPYLGTMGYVSMDTSTLVDLDLHMLFGKDEMEAFGFVPEIQAQYGFGGGAVGINVGLAMLKPDEADSETAIGNISVFGKGGYCISGPLELCFGGQLEVSVSPFEPDNMGELLAIVYGANAHYRLNRYGAKAVVISPAVGASMKLSIFWAQAHLGTDIVKIYDCPEGAECDADAALVFGVAGGVVLFDLLALGAGFRVLDVLTADDSDPHGVMDLIGKVMLGPIEPAVVLTLFLDEDTREALPVALTLGAAAKF